MVARAMADPNHRTRPTEYKTPKEPHSEPLSKDLTNHPPLSEIAATNPDPLREVWLVGAAAVLLSMLWVGVLCFVSWLNL